MNLETEFIYNINDYCVYLKLPENCLKIPKELIAFESK